MAFSSGKPSAPIGPLSVSDIGKDSCRLRWQPPTDHGGEPILGYLVEKREKSRANWSVAVRVSGEENTATVWNLIEDAEYVFRVAAENSVGIGEYLETETSIVVKRGLGKP